MSTAQLDSEQQTAQLFTQELTEIEPEIHVLAGSAQTLEFGRDRTANLASDEHEQAGPTLVRPSTIEQVQTTVRLAAKYGLSLVPRGAGTGLSGGATATGSQIVLSTEKLNRVLEISPEDQVAVVEPGVLNGALNQELEPLGLFYAPDPASAAISTIGGNIATNAGGMRCAKYGVTRESVLALQVVLADGSLVSLGHRSIKGVTGLDLVSLLVGSEGTLGIVVQATVRIYPIPVARQTLSVYFDEVIGGARAVQLINASTVQPAALELIDGPTLHAIDAHSGTSLSDHGGTLLLIELDGYGIREQIRDLHSVLQPLGGRLSEVSETEGQQLWELRRSGRGFDANRWHIGEDIAVPTSKLVDIFLAFPEIEQEYGVKISAVAHAGDGNLHPALSIERTASDDSQIPPQRLQQAATELVKRALALGGTVTGEHGVGSLKLHWAGLELSERVRQAQQQIKAALDPHSLLNPGKAL